MDDIPDYNSLSSGRSPLSAKLAAYGESLALERRFKRVEEGMTGKDALSAEESEVPAVAVFRCDAIRKTTSPQIRDTRVLEGPKSTNPSRSRIRQLRRPNTRDSGMFLSFFLQRIKSQSALCSVSSSKSSFLFTNERARGYHQSYHSISVVGTYLQGMVPLLNHLFFLRTRLLPTFRLSIVLIHRVLHPTISPPWTTCPCPGALLRLPKNLSRTFWRKMASTTLLRDS